MNTESTVKIGGSGHATVRPLATLHEGADKIDEGDSVGFVGDGVRVFAVLQPRSCRSEWPVFLRNNFILDGIVITRFHHDFVGLDEAVSLELVEAEPWACRVDLDGARSASGLPPRAGIAGTLAAGATAADTRAPFPRGAATLVRPGSGRMEPTATPAAPAATNTVILRTTSST